MSRPRQVVAIVSQNGNAYEEGLSDAWVPLRAYWSDPRPELREPLRMLLSLDTTRWQYLHGAPDEQLVAPEAWWLDHALLSRPGVDEIQLDLFLDYASNVALYPRMHEYFSSHQPPLLAIWGRHDPFFLPAGAEAFLRHNPRGEVQMLNAGHFALETHAAEIAQAVRSFLERNGGGFGA